MLGNGERPFKITQTGNGERLFVITQTYDFFFTQTYNENSRLSAGLDLYLTLGHKVNDNPGPY